MSGLTVSSEPLVDDGVLEYVPGGLVVELLGDSNTIHLGCTDGVHDATGCGAAILYTEQS